MGECNLHVENLNADDENLHEETLLSSDSDTGFDTNNSPVTDEAGTTEQPVVLRTFCGENITNLPKSYDDVLPELNPRILTPNLLSDNKLPDKDLDSDSKSLFSDNNKENIPPSTSSSSSVVTQKAKRKAKKIRKQLMRL